LKRVLQFRRPSARCARSSAVKASRFLRSLRRRSSFRLSASAASLATRSLQGDEAVPIFPLTSADGCSAWPWAYLVSAVPDVQVHAKRLDNDCATQSGAHTAAQLQGAEADTLAAVLT
jgi:hypothetical protein